ncbi:hypothetical protein DERP_005483 [Dermatophagoides pteronyssinus]|uniref:Uncharacterized protein n=1 Tax=Dermatophagoides pteronyssinus TaxID=6956 RepID=A0ABQ8JMX8_DERPT|nr:hypothetical protein DERP_005483 [Dermatophagoides pteronyssinus]
MDILPVNQLVLLDLDLVNLVPNLSLQLQDQRLTILDAHCENGRNGRGPIHLHLDIPVSRFLNVPKEYYLPLLIYAYNVYKAYKVLKNLLGIARIPVPIFAFIICIIVCIFVVRRGSVSMEFTNHFFGVLRLIFHTGNELKYLNQVFDKSLSLLL